MVMWTWIARTQTWLDGIIGGRTYGQTSKDASLPKTGLRWMVGKASLPDETVLDGRRQLASPALNLGRRFIGIEIEPKYFEPAAESRTRSGGDR